MASKGSKTTNRTIRKGTSKATTGKAAAAAAASRRLRRRTRKADKTALRGSSSSEAGEAAGGRKTKRAEIVNLLEQPNGASIEQLSGEIGPSLGIR